MTDKEAIDKMATEHADQFHMRKLPNGDSNAVWFCEFTAFKIGYRTASETHAARMVKALKDLGDTHERHAVRQDAEIARLRSMLEANSAGLVGRSALTPDAEVKG